MNVIDRKPINQMMARRLAAREVCFNIRIYTRFSKLNSKSNVASHLLHNIDVRENDSLENALSIAEALMKNPSRENVYAVVSGNGETLRVTL